MKPEITIVVSGGMVVDVFSTVLAKASVIDLDVQDFDEKEANQEWDRQVRQRVGKDIYNIY